MAIAWVRKNVAAMANGLLRRLAPVALLATLVQAHPGHGPGGAAGSGYVDALVNLEASTRSLRADAERRPTDWLPLESAARLYLERARLTGNYDDFARADSMLTRAFAIAPKKAGPFLTRAEYFLSIHRLADAEAEIAKEEGGAIIPPATRRAIAEVRADLLVEQGNYSEARTAIEALVAQERNAPNLSRLAILEWHLGQPARADHLLAEAESLYFGPQEQYRAWFRLQRGDLATARGNYDEALARYREAEELFQGWWLTAFRAAQVMERQQKFEAATFAYQDLVSRTNLPEVMDALAALYREQGEASAATRWIAKARRLHDAREARFAEAALGHALQHHLHFDPDPKAVVSRAERNRDLRSNGEAWTWLAQAQLRAGDFVASEAAIDRALKSGWRSAETWATGAIVARRMGNGRLERERLGAAVALNPDAPRLVAWLEEPPR